MVERALKEKKVIDQLWEQGGRIINAFNAMASELSLDSSIACVGYGPRSIIQFKTPAGEDDWDLKSYFQQECLRRRTGECCSRPS